MPWNRKSEEALNFEDLSKSKIEAAIDEWIVGRYAERNKSIVRRRLIDGICFEPLAEEFGLSVRQTKAIVYKCERIIFSHFDKRGSK